MAEERPSQSKKPMVALRDDDPSETIRARDEHATSTPRARFQHASSNSPLRDERKTCQAHIRAATVRELGSGILQGAGGTQRRSLPRSAHAGARTMTHVSQLKLSGTATSAHLQLGRSGAAAGEAVTRGARGRERARVKVRREICERAKVQQLTTQRQRHVSAPARPSAASRHWAFFPNWFSE